jgi:predicted dehydrogenase
LCGGGPADAGGYQRSDKKSAPTEGPQVIDRTLAAMTVRIGLVGYGLGGRVFHAPLLASADGVDFMGVVTTSPQRRAEVAERGLPAYDDLPALAAAGAQAVAISTPATTHAGLAREAIRLGLHTVVDKPFTLDAEAAREVVTAAADAGVVLSVYQNRRWDSDMRTVHKLIGDGALGEVRRFESRFERWAPQRSPAPAGGGTLLDFGSHLVDGALYLFGPATRVYAEMRGDGDLDDDVFVALHHESGVESHLWGSWRQAAPGPRFRVTGTTGTYIVDGIDSQEAALKAGRSPADLGERWGVEPESAWGRLHHGETGASVPSERGRWDMFYPAFAAAVGGTGEVTVNPWDAVRTMDALDAARISATTGETVDL